MFEQKPTAEPPMARVSVDQARAWFHDHGQSVSDWSVKQGFNPALVYAVLKGQRKCLRGQSFRIAVALGVKAAPEKVRARGPMDLAL